MLDLSLIANIIQILAALIATSLWLIHKYKSFKAEQAQLKKYSEMGKVLAERLLSRATSSESRADIYTYITLRAIDFNGRRTRAYVRIGLQIVVFILLTISSGWTITYINFKPLFMNSFVFLILLLSATTIIISSIYGELKIRKLEDGWLNGVIDAMNTKLEKHNSKTSQD